MNEPRHYPVFSHRFPDTDDPREYWFIRYGVPGEHHHLSNLGLLRTEVEGKSTAESVCRMLDRARIAGKRDKTNEIKRMLEIT